MWLPSKKTTAHSSAIQCVIGFIGFQARQQSKMDACLSEPLPLVSVAEGERKKEREREREEREGERERARLWIRNGDRRGDGYRNNSNFTQIVNLRTEDNHALPCGWSRKQASTPPGRCKTRC